MLSLTDINIKLKSFSPFTWYTYKSFVFEILIFIKPSYVVMNRTSLMTSCIKD